MLTREELRQRAEWLGATDMAAILNVNPRETAYDVWLEKTLQFDPEFTGSDAADVGLLLEGKVLEMAEKKLGKIIVPTPENRLQLALEGTPVRASLDGMVESTREPVEAKTSGLFSRLGPEWGEEETDEAPASYIVQVHVQMMCAGDDVQRGYIAALLGGRGFKLYPITRNERICKAIRVKSVAFWKLVTQAREALAGGIEPSVVAEQFAPKDCAPSLDVVKAVVRVPEKVVDFSEEQQQLVAAWQEAGKVKSAAEKAQKDAQARVIAALGDAEAARCGDFGAVTYSEEKRDGYTVEPYSFRQLRLRKKGL